MLDPYHARIATSYGNLASIYYRLNDLDSAIISMQRALSIRKENLASDHPNLKKVESNMAFMLEKRGQQLQSARQFQAAIQSFQKALEFKPDNATLYIRIGLCHYFGKNYPEAIENYEKSHQLNSENKFLYFNNTGLAYAKWGKLAEAKARLEQLQQLVPDDPVVYRNWAVYYALDGKMEEALSNLEKALELGYENVEWLQSEESLDGIRETERFRALLEVLKAKD